MSGNDLHRHVNNPITQTEDTGTQPSTQYQNISSTHLATASDSSCLVTPPHSLPPLASPYPGVYTNQQPPQPGPNFSYSLATGLQGMPHPRLLQAHPQNTLIPHPQVFSLQSWPYPYPSNPPSQWPHQNSPHYMPPPYHTDQWHNLIISAWLPYQKALSQQSQATPGSSMNVFASPPIPQPDQSLLHQPSPHYLGSSLVSGSSHSASHIPIHSTTATAMSTTLSQCMPSIAVNQPTLNVSALPSNSAVVHTDRCHKQQVYSVPPEIPSDTLSIPDTPGTKRVCLSSQNSSTAPNPSSIIRHSGSPSSGMASISTVSPVYSQKNSPFVASPVTKSDEHFSLIPVPSVEHNTSFTLPRPTFNMVYERLIDISAKWWDFGLALGLSNDILEAIDYNNHKCQCCLRETLAACNCKKSLTWRKVTKALRKKTVGRNDLAEDIEKIFSEQLDLTFQFDNPKDSGIPPHIDASAADPPECVVRYASYIREKYKRMPVLPDTWPPPLVGRDHFTKLALIERRKQACLPLATSEQSIEYYYAYGNVDNIVEKKLAIKLENLFDPILGEDSAPDQFIILMDGAPGVGKTTISRKICKDWANNKLRVNFRLVILLPLRELLFKCSDQSFSITNLLQADDLELKDQVVKYLRKTSGIGVLFIFDGFDELSTHQRTKHSLFLDIMKGNTLHNCSVLVTSRTYASGPLKEISRINRHVEVLGFNKQQINSCIEKNITEKDKAQLLLKMLKERLDIVSLCYIPLNCRIVLYVYQQQYTLPDTLTQLYEVFILHTIKHYADKIASVENVEVDEIKYANSCTSLPPVIIRYLDSLSKIAYSGMKEDKLVFEHSTIREAKCALSLGLLNMIDTLTSDGEKHYYQFLHFTIQEFLAARHLAQSLSREEKLAFVQSKINKDRFRITLLFLSGLTGLDFFSEDHPFPEQSMIDLKCWPRTIYIDVRSSRAQFLLLAQLLYESRNSSCGWLLLCLLNKTLNFSSYHFSQFDCLVFAHFLALTPKDHVWDLIDLNCPHTSDQLELFLCKLHSKTNIPILASTVELRVSCKANEVVLESHTDALSRIFESLQKVKIDFSLASSIPSSFWTNVLIGIANNSSVLEFEISTGVHVDNGLSIVDQFYAINLNRPIKKFSLSHQDFSREPPITCKESSLSLCAKTVENWSILSMFTDLDELEIRMSKNFACPLGLFQALQSLHITKLILSGDLSDKCYSALSEFVCTSKTLEFLKTEKGYLTVFRLNTISTFLTRTLSLKELCLRNSNVATPKLNWPSFFQTVRSNSLLKKLECVSSISFLTNNITGAARAVCDMIINNRELEELKLGAEYIDDEYDMFAEAVLKSMTLKQITIACFDFKQIKHFDFTMQRLGGEKIESELFFRSFSLGQVTMKIVRGSNFSC